MNSFLVNLARRGAGLPAIQIQVPPPSPFGPEVRNQGDRLAEEAATGGAVNQTPLPASSSGEMPSEAPIPHAPSIRHLYGTAPTTPIRPSGGEPTTIDKTPSLGSPPAPRRHVIPLRRGAEAAPIEPPDPQGPAVRPLQADREVVSPVARMIGPVREPERQAGTAVASSPLVSKAPGETQVVSPTGLPPERPRDEARETRTPARSVAAIRPAPADPLSVLQSPKAAPAPSPALPSQLPVHVRIGRVEVRAAPAPTPAGPGAPAAVGFAAYYRMRNYRG
jgi:hypothetical protein